MGAADVRFQAALKIQRRLGDEEGAGLTLGGLAALAAGGGDLDRALELYEQSLGAFEACGDRAEEARILSEMAWTALGGDDVELARHRFLDSIQAYTDIASVRGIGGALTGLAATEAAEGSNQRAALLAAAAEVYARAEGIVNVYSDETPGREWVERARAALPGDVLSRASSTGRSLALSDAIDFARRGRTSSQQ
jgi:tetratricopeptide (TPR) repeat protein